MSRHKREGLGETLLYFFKQRVRVMSLCVRQALFEPAGEHEIKLTLMRAALRDPCDCLPAIEFLNDEHRTGYIGGFGSGKSGARKKLFSCHAQSRPTVMACEPDQWCARC